MSISLSPATNLSAKYEQNQFAKYVSLVKNVSEMFLSLESVTHEVRSRKYINIKLSPAMNLFAKFEQN